MRRVSLGWMLRYGATSVGISAHDVFFNAVAGFFLASYGLPNVAIGFLANERSLIGSVLQPVTGALSDRLRTSWGRRKPFLLLLVPIALGFIVLAGRPPLPLMVGIFLLLPTLMGMVETAYEVLLPDNVVEEQRGTVNGVTRALGFIGGIGLMVVAAQTWDAQPAWAFFFVTGAMCLGLAVTLIGVSEPPAPASEPPSESSSGMMEYLRNLLAHREAARYVAAYFCYWFGIGGITPFLTRFGNQELGIPENETFILLVAVLVGTLVAAVPAGWLGDKVGKKPVTVWGVACFALAILLGSQLQTREQTVALLVLAGVAQAIPTALAYPLFTELVPVRRMGELTGLSTMIWSLAQPLGATTFGALADATGTLRTVLVGGAAALALACVLIALTKVPAASASAEAAEAS